MVELYFGSGYMRLPTRIRWKNMGKHGKTTNPSRVFKAFQALRRNDVFSDFPSFQIPSMTIQQNLALSEIKVGTIFTTERGYEN